MNYSLDAVLTENITFGPLSKRPEFIFAF